MGAVEGLRVLDAGCGEGVFCRELAARGALVVGVDISEELVGAARAAASPKGTEVHYLCGSLTKLGSLEDASFDLVTSVMVLMDVLELTPAVRELARCLKPGGRLLYSVCHPVTDRDGEGFTVGHDGCVNGFHFGNYFDRTPRRENWSFVDDARRAIGPDMTVINFPRTVGDYLNSTIESGLVVERVSEPVPPVAYEKGELGKHFTAPFYLIVSARRT